MNAKTVHYTIIIIIQYKFKVRRLLQIQFYSLLLFVYLEKERILFKMVLKCLLTLCILLVATLAQIQHKAVLQNDAYEQTLSNEFKNPFYKTARINAALKESSWLRPGEELVYDRQSEKIPRSEIYSVLSHAGLIQRRRQQKRSLSYQFFV